MKRFQEYMITNYPLRLEKHKAAFVANKVLFLAGGESN
jgi:hypothetical protein